MELNDIIRTIEYEKIGPSYKWENPNVKGTFHADQWVNATIDFLWYNKKVTEIEKEYTKKMPKISRSTNNMYIRSLLSKLQLESKQNFEYIRSKFSEEDIKEWVVKRINNIIEKHHSTAVKKAQKWMESFKEYIEFQEKNADELTFTTSEAIRKIDDISNRAKVDDDPLPVLDISNHNNVYDIKFNKNLNTNFYTNDNVKTEAVGKFGEQAVYNVLVQKYGFDNVKWVSNVEKFSPYDFRVENQNGKDIFIEVKSTTKSTIKFFFSRNEYEFWKIKKDEINSEYKIVLVYNINCLEESSLPLMRTINNPHFKIDMDRYGIENGSILVSPNSFISKV